MSAFPPLCYKSSLTGSCWKPRNPQSPSQSIKSVQTRSRWGCWCLQTPGDICRSIRPRGRTIWGSGSSTHRRDRGSSGQWEIASVWWRELGRWWRRPLPKLRRAHQQRWRTWGLWAKCARSPAGTWCEWQDTRAPKPLTGLPWPPSTAVCRLHSTPRKQRVQPGSRRSHTRCRCTLCWLPLSNTTTDTQMVWRVIQVLLFLKTTRLVLS